MQTEEKSNERSEWDPHAVSPKQTEPTRTKLPRRAPPNHPVKTLYRLLLWLLPAGFTAMCIFGTQYLGRFGIPPNWNGIICYLLISAFAFGTAWYNALLSNRARLEHNGLMHRIVLFWAIQHFLVPLLLVGFLYAACAIY